MYITITGIVGEKQINLAYPIRGKEVAIVCIFSDNIQYQVKKPLKVLMSNHGRTLPEGTFMASELSTFVARILLIAPLDGSDNITKTNKLAGVTEVVISLDELNITDNLKDERPSNVLLGHYMTSSEEFERFEPAILEYKKLKNWEFNSLTLRITDQKGKCITDGPGVTIVLHII